MPANRAADRVKEPGYPYWQYNNDGDLALYWLKSVEVGALVRPKPGGFEIHYSNENTAKTWNTAMTSVATMEEAQRVAETLLRITLL